MARRRQARPCSARRSTDGQPCRAYSIVGGTVCAAHGGSSPTVRAAARWRVELERTRRFVYREVERQRAREKRILADELLDVARVNGESIDETARAWPAAKWAAYVADPSLRERHERRRQDAEAADDRRRRRFVAEHQGRIAAL